MSRQRVVRAADDAGSLSTEPIGDLIRGWAGICREVHRSRVQLWRDVRAGNFPAPIVTGPNSLVWVRSEVDAWKASRPRRTYGHSETSEWVAAKDATVPIKAFLEEPASLNAKDRRARTRKAQRSTAKAEVPAET